MLAKEYTELGAICTAAASTQLILLIVWL